MRVCIVPEFPYGLMAGGLQVYAEELCAVLNQHGGDVQAELFAWSDHRPLPDLFHFVGFPPHWSEIAPLIRHAGVPYVSTMLFGNPRNDHSFRMARLRHWATTRILRRQGFDRAVLGASRLLVITEADVRAAQTIYGVPPQRIAKICNGVSEAFVTARAEIWQRVHGEADFFLCVGAIQPRKNQLRLVECANALRKPLVLLGPELPGEHEYSRLVEAAMSANRTFGGRWIKDLRFDDPRLISAYGACRAFVLPSVRETQPLSVLQAMAARKPVLLGVADYQKDPPFAGLPSADPNDPKAFQEALESAWYRGVATSLPQEHSWPEIARQTLQIYREVVRGCAKRQSETLV